MPPPASDSTANMRPHAPSPTLITNQALTPSPRSVLAGEVRPIASRTPRRPRRVVPRAQPAIQPTTPNRRISLHNGAHRFRVLSLEATVENEASVPTSPAVASGVTPSNEHGSDIADMSASHHVESEEDTVCPCSYAYTSPRKYSYISSMSALRRDKPSKEKMSLPL
jgi:hypothetical protein